MSFFLFLGGTRVRYKDTGEGHYHCPPCGTARAHRRARAGNYVHLYWIPLFRVQDLGEVVICRTCEHVRPVEAVLVRSGEDEARIWTCPGCGNVNPRSEPRCMRCDAPG